MGKITLEKLKENQIGIVISVEGSGEINHRLLDMGIVPGAKIKISKAAPFGDPLQIEIRGYSMCIRKETARKIIVEVER